MLDPMAVGEQAAIMICKVHAIQTGTVRIRPKQMAATARGRMRLAAVLLGGARCPRHPGRASSISADSSAATEIWR
jgi:hypothetical protein